MSKKMNSVMQKLYRYSHCRSVFVGILFCVAHIPAMGQTAEVFGRMGDSSYLAKNFQLAIEQYQNQAVRQSFDFEKGAIYYNIACCYALSHDKVNAWKYLEQSQHYGYNDYAHILVDDDLSLLHEDKRAWARYDSLNKIRLAKLSDPTKASLITTDIHNFWLAYDQVQQDTAHALDIYRKEYFEKASVGLQDYYAVRIFSVENFVKNQQKKPAFYKAIRANTFKVDEYKPQIRASFVKLKKVYPQAIFPSVYFVIGRWNSGGTVSSNGLLIGTDMMSKSSAVPLAELTLWEKNNYKSIDGLPQIVAHELIHSQQNDMKEDTTTLSQCIREGMADFLGEMISGKSSNERLLLFAKGREKTIWNDFEKDMYLNRARNWIANADQERPDHPADLGYWMGYQLCKSYYEEMPDKKKAIYDMLHIQDYKDFLTKSRYDEKVKKNQTSPTTKQN